MAAEGARWGKLTQLVSDHILGHVYRDKFVAVVDCEGVSDEIRRDHRGAAPCLDDRLFAGFVHGGHLLFELNADEWSFFK